MEILIGWLTPVRVVFLWIDTIAFSLIDNVYDLFQIFAKNQIISDDAVRNLIDNIYILVGVIAFFRLAMLLVNAIINPDTLFKEKQGLGNILVRTVVMLVALVLSPILFNALAEIQGKIIDNNLIPRVIMGNNGTTDIEASKKSNYFTDAGKTMQKIVITTLIKPEDEFFIDGEAGVQNYLNDEQIADDSSSGHSELETSGYVYTTTGQGGPVCNKTCRKAMSQYHQMIKQSAKGGFKLRRLLGYVGGSAEVEVEGSNSDSEDLYYYEYIAGLSTISAIFLTYIMLSWSIDIAIRSVELAVLRILSPLFIATIVDPKSTTKGGYFHNWLMRYLKTYADLFLKLAIISLAILLISLVQDMDIWNMTVGG